MDNPSTLDIIKMYTEEIIEELPRFYVEEFAPFDELRGFDVRMVDVFDVVGSIRVRDTGVAINYAQIKNQGTQRFLSPIVLVFDMVDPEFTAKFKDTIEDVIKHARAAHGS